MLKGAIYKNELLIDTNIMILDIRIFNPKIRVSIMQNAIFSSLKFLVNCEDESLLQKEETNIVIKGAPEARGARGAHLGASEPQRRGTSQRRVP